MPELSNELKQFIARNIETAAQAEVLILLQRDPQRDWRLSEITRELRGTTMSTARWLEKWQVAGLVGADQGTFRFRPSSPELRQRAAELADAFQTRPGTVVQCIHSRPPMEMAGGSRARKRG